ncbi:site-specific tyrosine recombinase XerD [Mesonia sp. K7]|uniref:site-specific tyrosine recombinase XerD n=1 Tax=Mesonia sp. K7 TaxID=2218606 RepID=UPI000DA7FACC|nr:site-specific tyrosine recombinase XerD [Mesonia sp. K7]PZD79453.1 site-specific tyrosine recombinase XerD [Mesonia sp. K7]
MNWKDALNDFNYYLKLERGLSDNSIVSYSYDIQKLITFLEKNKISVSPIKIDENQIQEFIYEVAKTMNTTSQARIISGLRSFFDYLVFENYRDKNPLELVEAPKIGRKLPDTLNLEEIDLLIRTVDLSHPQGERNRAIIETLYSCGLRVSELINLKISDLFFEENFIKVTGKGDKQRFVPVSPVTKKYILLYKNEIRIHQTPKKGKEDILFLNRRGNQLTRAMIFTIVKDLAEKANLNKNISPHTFRHSFATHLLENGADLSSIQQMLGHESIATTEIYMHIDNKKLFDVLEKYHPRSNKS